jgi:hypothetical protein
MTQDSCRLLPCYQHCQHLVLLNSSNLEVFFIRADFDFYRNIYSKLVIMFEGFDDCRKQVKQMSLRIITWGTYAHRLVRNSFTVCDFNNKTIA